MGTFRSGRNKALQMEEIPEEEKEDDKTKFDGFRKNFETSH